MDCFSTPNRAGWHRPLAYSPRVIWAAAAILIHTAGPPLWANPGSKTVRLAIIVGNNQGSEESQTLKFAEHDAEKIYTVLRQLGNFETENIRYLPGAAAEDVWRAFESFEKRIKQLKVMGQQTVLLFYFSGHGNLDNLELGRSKLAFTRLKECLSRSQADVRLAIVDACKSGRLVAMKGGRRAGGFQIDVDDEMASKGYAIITSSAADELSQESTEIRGSFFTHYMVSALRGAADRTQDGRVTLSEAYRYAYNRTVARTTAHIGGGQHPMYDFRIAGHGDITLTTYPKLGSLLTLRSPRPGRLIVLDQSGDSVVVEGEVGAERQARLALAPGTYQVYLITQAQAIVYRAVVKVSPGRGGHLDPGAFSPHRLHKSIPKGGLFRRQRTHLLSGGFLLRRLPLAEATVSYGLAVLYRIEWPSGWRSALKLCWSAAPDAGISKGYFDLAGFLGGGYVWRVSSLALSAEGYVGYEQMFQSPRAERRRATPAVSTHGAVEAAIPLAGVQLTLSGAAGARSFQLLEQGWVHRFDFQFILGVGWALWGGS